MSGHSPVRRVLKAELGVRATCTLHLPSFTAIGSEIPGRACRPERPRATVPMGTVSQSSCAERYPQAFCATSNRPQGSSEASPGGDCHRSIAATSLGVAGRMEGQAIPFSEHTNCFSSPSARGTWSFLDRRKPPRK